MNNQSGQEAAQQNVPGDGAAPAAVEEKATLKGFRLKPSEEALVDKLIEYAYIAGFIKETTFQAYMMFALNCAYLRLQQDHQGGAKK